MTTPAPLTGLAIGDALGMQFETEKPTAPALVNWDGSYGPSAYHGLKEGQFTDDTQLPLALAASILEKKRFDPEDVAKNYLGWFTGDCRGIGDNPKRALRQAMLNLQQGKAWTVSGIEAAEGNGTAPRGVVFGAHHHRAMERYRAGAHFARMDASITHKSEEAAEGSAAVAIATAHLCSGGRKLEVLTTVLEHTNKTKLRFALEDVYRAARRGDTVEEFLKTRDWSSYGVSTHVVQTVPAAFAMFVYYTDFDDTVKNAVRLGGDTDSVAGLAGALAGAHYGIEGIPEALLTPLERAADIRDIELRLMGLK